MRRSMKMMALIGITAMVGALGACAPRYDGFDCRILNETPSPSQCSDQGISVARGEALVLRLSPKSENNQDFEDAQMELRPTDPQLVSVRPGLNNDQTVIGLTLAQTTLEVWLDGALESEVSITVNPSTPSAPSD